MDQVNQEYNFDTPTEKLKLKLSPLSCPLGPNHKFLQLSAIGRVKILQLSAIARVEIQCLMNCSIM